MVNTLRLPESLLQRADQTNEDATIWWAFGSGRAKFKWTLDPDELFGRKAMSHWIGMLAKRQGFPLRVQWRTVNPGGGVGILLHNESVFGPEDDEADEEGGMAPSMFLPEPIEFDSPPTSVAERILEKVFNDPERFAAAFWQMASPLMKWAEQRDQRIVDQAVAASEKAARMISASLIKEKFTRVLEGAGYEQDEAGKYIDPVQTEGDYPDHDVDRYDDADEDEDEDLQDEDPPGGLDEQHYSAPELAHIAEVA